MFMIYNLNKKLLCCAPRMSKIVFGKIGGMCSNQANWVICTMSIKEIFVTYVTFFGGKEITGHKL